MTCHRKVKRVRTAGSIKILTVAHFKKKHDNDYDSLIALFWKWARISCLSHDED